MIPRLFSGRQPFLQESLLLSPLGSCQDREPRRQHSGLADLILIEQEDEIAATEVERLDQLGGPLDVLVRPLHAPGSDERQYARAESGTLERGDDRTELVVGPALTVDAAHLGIARLDSQADPAQPMLGEPLPVLNPIRMAREIVEERVDARK